MSTRLTYRTAVQLRGFDALATATIDAAVEEGRRRVLTDHRWSFAETTNATLSTVAGTSSVSLATITDLAYIDAVTLSSAGVPVSVEYVERGLMRDLQAGGASSGTPQAWTRVKGTIVFWPTPSAVFTVTVEYMPNPTALAADATVCPIPDRHADLVTWCATVPLAFRQRQLAESSAADQYYSKVLLPRAKGQDDVEQRQTSRQIKTGHWGD
jgi:hypothetical protein